MARPSFKPTPKLRHRVAVSAGGGMAHEEIALALGISRNTLEKHFEHELSIGAMEKRQQVIEAMFKSAKDGNVTAQRSYIAMGPQIAAPPLPEAEPKPAKVGKKVQQQSDAVAAHQGTDWADILTPEAPLQ